MSRLTLPHLPVRLLVTLGAKPQLATLALDDLHQQGVRPVEVAVFHTDPARPATATALKALRGAWRALPAATRPRLRLVTLSHGPGQPLADVLSETEVQAAFKALYAEVHTAKQAGHAVHILIAGGRRTLTVFGMAVAQLLFDAHDRLWHLASHPALEARGDLHAGPGEWTRLIPIPVVTWGQASPAFLTLREVSDPQEAVTRLTNARLRAEWELAQTFVMGALSAGERQVVQALVRDGLTTQAALAARLCLSTRTVESHLRSAYRKAANHWELPQVNQAQLVRLLRVFYALNPENSG